MLSAGAMEGQRRKRRVLSKHEAEMNRSALFLARSIAEDIAQRDGGVTADQVRIEFVKRCGEESWGPWAGIIFRDPRFETSGGFRASAIPEHHGCMLRVWRLACTS